MTYVKCAIYEARNSDDVDYFLAHNPEENGAILFYDPNQEKSPNTSSTLTKVMGVFKNIGEDGRSNDAWVNQLNDKVHLMRVDATSLDNARVVQEFKVGKTPLLILLDYGTIQLMEIVNDKSYDHLKEFYAEKIAKAKQQAEAAKAAAEADKNNQTSGGAEDALTKAMKAAEDAKKAAQQALKTLEEANKAFEQHLKDHHGDTAGKNATNSTAAADGKCSTQPSGQKPADGKCDSGAANTQGQTSGAGGAQSQYQIEYVPVYKRLDQSYSSSSTPVRYVSHGDHWHVLNN